MDSRKLAYYYFVMHEPYLFLITILDFSLQFLFTFLEIYVLRSTNDIYTVTWESEKTFWRDQSKIKETTDTMHNIIIPSGRVQNRRLGNQSLAAISLLVQQERSISIMQSRNWRTKIRVDTFARTLRSVQLDFVREILFLGLNYDKYLASRLTTLFPLTSHAN